MLTESEKSDIIYHVRGRAKQKDISNRIEKDKKANTTINWCKTKAVIINYWANRLNEEFDPGSGWTLTECLTHASLSEFSDKDGGRVSNA